MDTQQQIVNEILNKNNKNIAIIMHDNPDADAIGSATALENVLLQLNKEVNIIIQTKIHKSYAKIIGKKRTEKLRIPKHEKYDLFFILDCSEESRIGFDYKYCSNNFIVIDHHIGFKKYGNIYLCEDVPATGMIIFELIKCLTLVNKSIKINEFIATSLFLAIRGDTSGFKTDNVNSNVFDMSSQLINFGANIKTVNNVEDYSMSMIRLMGNVFSNISYDKQYKIIYLLITKEQILSSNSTFGDAANLIDIIKYIENVDVAYLFIQNCKTTYIKSRSDKYNIVEIMQYYGGGGHKHAAGASSYGNDSYDLIESVLTKTKKMIDKEL